MHLSIEGQTVTRVCFDEALVFLFSSDYELRIETSTTLEADELGSSAFEPESPGVAAATLVQLLHENVTLARTSPQGTLQLKFDCGTALTVAADPDYEAWGLVGPKERVVCMPGGEVATWPKEAD